MSNIIYGNLELNDEVYPFLMDGSLVHIVQQAFQNFDKFNVKENIPYLKGITSDNREIMFLKCRLVTMPLSFKTIFSIHGYIISTSNTGEPCDFSFDRITFYSNYINAFYSPQNAIDKNSYLDIISSRFDGAVSIKIKPFEETNILFEFDSVANCQFNISRSINLKDNTEQIGNLSSMFSYVFYERQGMDNIINYYLYLYDFLVFVNYNKNIYFEKIFLETKNDEGKYYKTAEVNFLTNTISDEKNFQSTITINDLPKEKLSVIFKKISSLRKNDKRLYLYYPENSKERNIVDVTKWLTAAICFEGLFKDVYPDFKQEENKNFKKAKNLVLNSINESIEKDETLTKKEQGYVIDCKKQVERYEGFLEEKFNYILKENKKVLEKILLKNQRDFGIFESNEYGKIYADYRNELAHGSIEGLSNDKIAVYRLLRAMIYILLLNEIELNEECLSRIINKIFV